MVREFFVDLSTFSSRIWGKLSVLRKFSIINTKQKAPAVAGAFCLYGKKTILRKYQIQIPTFGSLLLKKRILLIV